MALAAGKSIRWVASQLGHANPELTLRVYAHAMPEEESDLGFLDFSGGTRRHPGGTTADGRPEPRNLSRATARKGTEKVERETGFEPATTTLATWSSTTELLALGNLWMHRRGPRVKGAGQSRSTWSSGPRGRVALRVSKTRFASSQTRA